MLEFKNRELLEKYQYNTVALSNDLMDRMHHIQSLERQGQNIDRIRLPFADSYLTAPIREAMHRKIEQQQQDLQQQWKELYGSGYPYIKDKDGTLTHASRMTGEHLMVPSRDGWYHIPDTLCQNAEERQIRQQFEKECAQLERQIPYETGKQIEQMFLETRNNAQQLWAHRTGLSMDGGDLSAIATRGLIVPTQGHGKDEEAQLEYTATPISMNAKGFIQLLRIAALEEYKNMQGTVVCRTQGTPKILGDYLQPDQIVCYIARDACHRVCRYLDTTDMMQVHNTKTILENGKEMEVDRKSAQELTANDYRSFSHPMLEHQSITLINDSYDGRVENCSIAYGDRIYGNLESMARGLGLTQIQEWICNDCIQMFAQDIQRETGADMECQPEMDVTQKREPDDLDVEYDPGMNMVRDLDDWEREEESFTEWQPEMDTVWRQEQKMEVKDMER